MTHLKRSLVRLPIAVVALALTIASALVSALPSHAVVVAPSREALKARALYYFATAQSAERSVMIGTLRDVLIFVVCGSVAGFGCWDAKLLGYGQRAAFFRRCRVRQSSAGFQT